MVNNLFNDVVLVIGSKPDTVMPNIIPKKIYAANGAAERAIVYKEKNPSTHIISITGSAGLKVNEVRERITKLKPDELISHNGKIDLNFFFEASWIKDIKYRYLEKKGLDIQRKYFSKITLRLADLGLVFGSGNIFFGILRLIYALIKNKPPIRPVTIPIGISSGAIKVRARISAQSRNIAPITADAKRTLV